MIRSLYSGVSGLTTHQTRMDVIGNNIANVNTYGYKTQRATFRDIYYQAARSATSGKAAYAGNNVSEVGYGVRLGSIDKDMSPSSGQSTGKNWDMMIEADGFFITARSTLYTRMGNFNPDNYGNLATSDNRFVIGSRNSLDGLKKTGALSENALDEVQLKDRNNDGQINASDITFRNTINLNELIQSAYGVYTDEFGFMFGINWEALIGADATLTADIDNGGLKGNYIAYDYDGTAENFAAIAPTAADKLKYVDVQQTLRNMGVIGGDDEAKEKFNAYVAAQGAATLYAVDKTGKQITLEAPAGDDSGVEATYVSHYNAMRAAKTADDGQTDATLKTALKAAKAVAESFKMVQGELTYSNVGTLNITENGQIICNYNGDMKYLARIELACFDNVDGLAEAGGTNFAQSVASGEARINNPNTEGAGPIKNTYLEMSNVNLANEFSDMIVTQRGYQANARMITTSDSMLEELVNLKR